MKLIKGRGK